MTASFSMLEPTSMAHAALPADISAALVGALADSALIVAVYDPQDVLRWANASYQQLFLRGLAPPLAFADVLRHGFHQGLGVRIGSGDIETFLADILPRRAQLSYRAIEVDTVCGRWLWMTESRQASGWLLSVAADITALKHNEHLLRRAHELAETAARTDTLTSLPNRRHLMEFGEAALARCRRTSRPCSVAVIDLDHFKRFNDQLGHAGGDAVLQAFSQHCRSLQRQGDFFARMGGEEFVLITEGAMLAEAVLVLARWRNAWDQQGRSQLPAGAEHCEFSAGVAQAGAEETLSALLVRADHALYRAKLEGRNRTLTDLPADQRKSPHAAGLP